MLAHIEHNDIFKINSLYSMLIKMEFIKQLHYLVKVKTRIKNEDRFIRFINLFDDKLNYFRKDIKEINEIFNLNIPQKDYDDIYLKNIEIIHKNYMYEKEEHKPQIIISSI